MYPCYTLMYPCYTHVPFLPTQHAVVAMRCAGAAHAVMDCHGHKLCRCMGWYARCHLHAPAADYLRPLAPRSIAEPIVGGTYSAPTSYLGSAPGSVRANSDSAANGAFGPFPPGPGSNGGSWDWSLAERLPRCTIN